MLNLFSSECILGSKGLSCSDWADRPTAFGRHPYTSRRATARSHARRSAIPICTLLILVMMFPVCLYDWVHTRLDKAWHLGCSRTRYPDGNSVGTSPEHQAVCKSFRRKGWTVVVRLEPG
jgi:hypothetical protein